VSQHSIPRESIRWKKMAEERFKEIRVFCDIDIIRDTESLTLEGFSSLWDDEANIIIARIQNYQMKADLRGFRGTIY
jgi:hypothetical protein